MAAFPNFDTSNSNEVGLNFDVLHGLSFEFLPISDSQQRQTENGNRNNDSATANSLVSSASLTSQTSHNFYSSLSSNMLPTPEGSGSDNNAMCPESLMLSPYNMLPGSGHLTMEDSYNNKDEEFFYEPLESPESGVSFIPNYLSASYLSPQTSPTLPPDASMNINSNSPTRRQSQEKRFSPITKPKKVSPNNKNSVSQSRRKSSFTNSNNANGNNSSNHNNSNNSANGQNNAITNLPNIMTGSPDKLNSSSIAMLSLLELELTSPLMNDVVATSIAPSLQDTMPNLNLGSNLESDVTSANIRPVESSSSDKLAPITPSSLMKMKKKQPNSPKSIQDELNSNSQQQKQQNQQDQSQQQKDYSAFIAPTPPTQSQLNHRSNIATTGAASPSGASGKKSARSNPNSSPLALGPPKSPHSMKPTISPNLKPKLPGVLANEVAEQLANKSNYRSILEGTAQSLGISYPSDVHSSLESRRTTHKAAEQKRRDSLKQSFDELKKVVPYQSILGKSDGNINNNSKSNGNGKSGDGTMKNVSKLFLLKRAHDHIVELEQKSKEKDEIIQNLKDELDMLKRAKRQKIEETEKKENADDEVDAETKPKNERQISSNEC